MLLLLPVSVYGLLSCSEMFQQHNGVSNLPLSNGDLKTDLLKSQPFEEGFQMKTKLNGGHFACFQIVRLPDFRSHLRSGPFANQPTSIGPLKIRHVWISDFLGCFYEIPLKCKSCTLLSGSKSRTKIFFEAAKSWAAGSRKVVKTFKNC